MEPFKQWTCDVCGKIIDNSEDAYVVWGTDESDKIDKMRIVHKNYRHEDGTLTGCDLDQKTFNRSLPISAFLGGAGIAQLLSLIDPGEMHTSECRDNIADMRMFVEMFRRFQIPYYEEARLCLPKAFAQGFLCGTNEVATYVPDTLKAVIERYKD
ncbi:hypothetical protein NE562_05570 [Butyricicoccus faecihominis]|uniref:hypothetical protein n=1 Tax=Butyricicoccus faecihominis TaxID=1712515 RepID=UPI00247A9489|nr:hypothetical protein [Butyricicoccus faecihominis]MCQ5129121.1 hypothetical protein [Butyricicoccus faecihominis]